MTAANQGGIHHELLASILDGDGQAPAPWRRAAFDNTAFDNTAFDNTAFDNTGPADPAIRVLTEKTATEPTRLTDADFDRANDAGLSQDQIWELVICAAVGQASRQYEGALDALAAAVQHRTDPDGTQR